MEVSNSSRAVSKRGVLTAKYSVCCSFNGYTGAFHDDLCDTDRGLLWTRKSTTRHRLTTMLAEVNDFVKEDLKMLQKSSDIVVGMRIFQYFVIDLLGRNSKIATIFRTKTEAE